MTKRDFEMRTDGLGIGLFAIGVFCAVLVCQALFQGVARDPGRLQAFAAIWVSAIGPVPSLAFDAALAGLGARLFLGNVPDAPRDTVRHVAGAAFVSLGLSILLGSFNATFGGAFGDAIGGLLAARVHVALGVVFGLVVIAATAWFTWLRSDALPEEEAPSVRNPDREDEASHAEEAVSAAEAEALLPTEPVRAPRSAPPPSPYPEDVRRRGEIPAGTRPIGAPGGEAAVATPAATASAYRWTAPAARKHDADRPVPTGARREDDEERARADDRYAAADAPAADARAVALPRPAWEDDEAVDAYGTPRSLVAALRRDGAPANERPAVVDEPLPVTEQDEFEEELSEPVPLEARATSASELVAEPEAALADEDDDVELEVDDEVDLADEELDDELAIARVDEEQDAKADDESDDEETDTVDEDDDEALDVVDATDAAADELAAAEAELAKVEEELAETDAAFARALADLGDESADDDEPEHAETVLEPAASFEPAHEPVVEREALSEPVPETIAASALFAETPVTDVPAAALPEPEPSSAPISAEVAPETAKPLVRTLFDAPGPEDALAPGDEPAPKTTTKEKRSTKRARTEPAREPQLQDETQLENDAERELQPASSIFSATSEPAERDVVLVPPATTAERAVKTPAGSSSPRSALLAEVGCLFIERGRVAVSMLQRQYSMDFDDACKVLDELQDMGLIGPYLGGQRRDILLTRDAWLEKVGTS